MKFLTLSLVAVMLALSPVAPVTAESRTGCPRSFELHAVMPDHDAQHTGHIHVGRPNPDRNGDGLICVKQVVTPIGEIHIHIDNFR